jgi:hypothetical protein
VKASLARILRACGFVVMVGVVGLLLFGMLYNPITPAPSAQTRNQLAQAELALRILEMDKPGYLERLTATAIGSQSTYGLWLKLIDGNLDLFGSEREQVRSFFCVDAWTNEFNVSLKKDLPRGQCSQGLLDKESPFVLWSSGPNRSNEFGKGDDVVYERPNTFAQPDGAANRSQPIRVETNRTSAAAGSDR